MRKVIGILFYILAGFFVYMVCLMAFVNQPPLAKWGVLAGCSLPAIVFLISGLAVNRFQRWKRDVGVVLMSGAGLTAFIVFTIACLLLSEEFRQMMQPDSLAFFNAYVSGIVFLISVSALGTLLLKAEKKTTQQM